MSLVPIKLEHPPHPFKYIPWLFSKEGKLSVVSYVGLNVHPGKSKYTLRIQIPVDDGFCPDYVASNKDIENLIKEGKFPIPCVLYRDLSGRITPIEDHPLVDQWRNYEDNYLLYKH